MSGTDRIIRGPYKGHRHDDMADTYWSIGYKLPIPKPTPAGSLKGLCVQAISEQHLNIERLPRILREEVNHYHSRHGISRVKDPRYFKLSCCNHDQRENNCRQCIRRKEAWNSLELEKKNVQITEGVLVSDSWRRRFRAGQVKETKPIGNRQENKTFMLGDIEPARPTVPYETSIVSLAKRQPLRFSKLSMNATTPTRGTDWSAGLDLYSAAGYCVRPGTNAMVALDLQFQIPPGCYGRIAPRSGLAVRKSIHVGAGVIDSDFRGNVQVVLYNLGKEDFKIDIGDRVAQLILERIYIPVLQEVLPVNNTKRGTSGFGSTGK